jgi:hypothetical protein
MMRSGNVQAQIVEAESTSASLALGSMMTSSHADTRMKVNADRLDYIADMIEQIRDMSSGMPHSSLPAILDAALIEARLQKSQARD